MDLDLMQVPGTADYRYEVGEDRDGRSLNMPRNKSSVRRASEAGHSPKLLGAHQPIKRAKPPTRADGGISSSLHRVEGSPLSSLSPGEILVLSDSNNYFELEDAIFYAVLACPSCGALIPVTPSQYLGA